MAAVAEEEGASLKLKLLRWDRDPEREGRRFARPRGEGCCGGGGRAHPTGGCEGDKGTEGVLLIPPPPLAHPALAALLRLAGLMALATLDSLTLRSTMPYQFVLWVLLLLHLLLVLLVLLVVLLLPPLLLAALLLVQYAWLTGRAGRSMQPALAAAVLAAAARRPKRRLQTRSATTQCDNSATRRADCEPGGGGWSCKRESRTHKQLCEQISQRVGRRTKRRRVCHWPPRAR